jgi:ATP-binding cassette subfamily B protein
MNRKKSFPIIIQRTMTECGPTCLAMIFKYYGYYNIQPLLNKLAEVTTEGADLYHLALEAEHFGFKAEAYELGSIDHLSQMHLPLVAHYSGNHFIVVYYTDKDFVWVADPAFGKDKIAKTEFVRKWNGIVLTLEPTPKLFKNKDLNDSVEEFRKEQQTFVKKFYWSVISSLKNAGLEILAATFFLQLLGLAIPLFTQVIVDKVLVNQDKELLFAILLGMGGIFFTQILLLYVRNMLLVQFRINFEYDFFSKFFRHFISLKQKYYDNNKREDFMARFQENLTIRRLLNPGIIQTIIDLAFVLLYVPLLIYYNAKLGLLALFFVLIFFLFTAYYAPVMIALLRKVSLKNYTVLGEFLDTLLGIKTVKLLSLENFRLWKWKNKYKKALNVVLESETQSIMMNTLQQSLFNLAYISVFWLGAYLTFKGEMTIGQYLAFISIFVIVTNSLGGISAIWFDMNELWVSLERLNQVLQQETEQVSLVHHINKFSIDKITAHNLAFRYNEGDEEYIFKNLNFEINKGEHIGIIGRNGCGKTTLVKLLLNLYPEYEGKINFDHHELRKLNPDLVRKRVFLFPQDIYIFADTLQENILFGNPSASIDDVIRAAKLSGLHDFAKAQYLGYNHMLGDSGSNLSGGQKLKIGFARLFLSNPDVIILDEASSALDIESEKLVMDNLNNYFKDKTIITIAHRMQTLRNADRIWVLDNGSIVEDGPHETLMKTEGLYHQFMTAYLYN